MSNQEMRIVLQLQTVRQSRGGQKVAEVLDSQHTSKKKVRLRFQAKLLEDSGWRNRLRLQFLHENNKNCSNGVIVKVEQNLIRDRCC